MKPIRLPPAPVDTALARAVARIVRAVSDYLPWVLRDRIRIHEARHLALRASFETLEVAYRELARDFRKLMHPPLAPPMYSDLRERIEDRPWGAEIIRDLRVAFEPLRYAIALPVDRRQMTLGEETLEVLRHLARNIALAHVDQHAEEIYRLTVARKGFDPNEQKGA